MRCVGMLTLVIDALRCNLLDNDLFRSFFLIIFRVDRDVLRLVSIVRIGDVFKLFHIGVFFRS